MLCMQVSHHHFRDVDAGLPPSGTAPASGFTFQSAIWNPDTGTVWNFGGWSSYGASGCATGVFQSLGTAHQYSTSMNTRTPTTIAADPTNGTPVGRGYGAAAYDTDDHIFLMEGGHTPRQR